MPSFYGVMNKPWPPQYNQSTAWPQSGVGPTYNQFGQKVIGGQVFDAPTSMGGMPAPGMPRPAMPAGPQPAQSGMLAPGFPAKPMFTPGTAPLSQAAFTPGARSIGMGMGQGRGIPPFPSVATPSSLPMSQTAGTPAPRRTVFPGF